MRLHSVCRAAVAVLLVASAPASAAAADRAARAKAGACAAFVRRVQQADRAGVVRPDLYTGLSGWIAGRSGLDPGEVDALARSAQPDASSCGEFALAPEPLRALETVVAKVPAERVRASAEACLANLRLLDELAEGPHQATLRALDTAQARTVGRLLGYVAPALRPGPGAVQARLEALRAGGGDLRGAALGPSLSACEPLGVDVAQVKQAHSAP